MEFPLHVLAKKPDSALTSLGQWLEVSFKTLVNISAWCILQSQVSSWTHPPLGCRAQILQILNCVQFVSHKPSSMAPELLCDLFQVTSLCIHPPPACTFITASLSQPGYVPIHHSQMQSIKMVFCSNFLLDKSPRLGANLIKTQHVLRGGETSHLFTSKSEQL